MPRLSVSGLTKSFFGVRVLHEVSFEAQAGEVLGLVGENGSGKSTTMNIIAGILQRDSGEVRLDGIAYLSQSRRQADAAGVAIIQQELSIFPNLTVAENLFLGRFPRLVSGLPLISGAKLKAHARELLSRVELNVSPGMIASALSPGERQLLEIARALATDARVMIFDEPTTSLTQKEAGRLFEIIGRLRSRGIAVIYISHSLEDVLHLSDRIVVMRDGRVTLRAPSADTTAHDLIVAMVGRAIEALFPERAPVPENLPRILEVEALSQPGVIDGITFHIGKGEIVGLAGLMGAGRSPLARILFGLDPYSRGIIRLDGCALTSGRVRERIDAGAAFLTEDRRHEGLMMDASVADNMALAALPMFARGAPRRIEDKRLTDAMQSLADRLNLKSGPLHSTVVHTLSGGNQQKVVLGRWLLRQPSFFVLDEPTRGVDVGAKEEIYRVLAELAGRGTGMLLISSEIEELIGLADRILVMRHGRLQAQFPREAFDRQSILKAAFGQAMPA